MFSQLRASLACFVLLSVITGGIYPLMVTFIAQSAFPVQANGSIRKFHGVEVGSQLLGQSFTQSKYFWSRPSATEDAAGNPLPYNGFASSGSNLAPSNPAQFQAVHDRIAAMQKADLGNTKPVPVELVTASASGLDPDISVAAAEYQIARVARARGLAESIVESRVQEATRERTFGILGQPRVNVLELNLALDGLGRH